MQSAKGRAVIAIATMLALASCGGKGEPQLMNLHSGQGPDEFAIVPPKALEMPEDITALPEPTPNGSNRTDATPLDDAVEALGGQPQAANGIPSGDSAIYAHASRFGVESGIRERLASEDLEWRRDNDGRILERLLNVNVYYKAYRNQSLDQHAALRYWRKKGVKTPSAPPPEDGE